MEDEPTTCERCGLLHVAGELFVYIAPQVMVETCELLPAFRAAHAAPQPPSAVAYHATHPALLQQVLTTGLDPSRGTRPHLCLAETAGIAAGVLLPKDNNGLPYVVDDRRPVVLELDVSGLDLFFELGEARHHDAIIEPSRLRVIDFPEPDMRGWHDPAWRRDHSDCLARKGLPLSRRLINEATDEFYRRFPYATDKSEWRGFVIEYATADLW